MMQRANKETVDGLDLHTKLIAAGRDPEQHYGFVNPPIYRGSTILFPNTQSLIARDQPYVYGRRGTPTSVAMEDALRSIDGSAGVVLCPSGLAAISTALLSCLSHGDHLLITDNVYAPTREFCDRVLSRFGISSTYFDPMIGAGIANLFRPNTKAIFLESPGSLTFEIQDVPAITDVAQSNGATVLLDNTWGTPLFFDAIGLGVDLTILSGTKYLVGHSDAMFGTVSASSKAWPALKSFHGDAGLCVGPDDINLALRGLRTLAVRLHRHEESALKVAEYFCQHPLVRKVLHPAVSNSPGHAYWKRDFRGSSGLFSIIVEPGPPAALESFLDNLSLFGRGYSWGGFESLVLPFDCARQRTATTWRPEGTCIRLHIGLESPRDLIADLGEGLIRYRAIL